MSDTDTTTAPPLPPSPRDRQLAERVTVRPVEPSPQPESNGRRRPGEDIDVVWVLPSTVDSRGTHGVSPVDQRLIATRDLDADVRPEQPGEESQHVESVS